MCPFTPERISLTVRHVFKHVLLLLNVTMVDDTTDKVYFNKK